VTQQKLPKTPQTLKPPYQDPLTHTHPHPTSSTPVGSPCFPLFGMRLSLVLGAGDEELDGHLHQQKGGGKEMKKKSGCPIGNRTRHSPSPVGPPHRCATPASRRSPRLAPDRDSVKTPNPRPRLRRPADGPPPDFLKRPQKTHKTRHHTDKNLLAP